MWVLTRQIDLGPRLCPEAATSAGRHGTQGRRLAGLIFVLPLEGGTAARLFFLVGVGTTVLAGFFKGNPTGESHVLGESPLDNLQKPWL